MDDTWILGIYQSQPSSFAAVRLDDSTVRIWDKFWEHTCLDVDVKNLWATERDQTNHDIDDPLKWDLRRYPLKREPDGWFIFVEELDLQALDRPLAEVYGGAAAGWRMTAYYRGDQTVLHVDAMPDEALRQLRAIPDTAAGPLTILRTPGTIAYEGTAARLAHPLLVYTEMMASTDSRAREAAAEILERFLEPSRESAHRRTT
jgi:Transcriptional regulator, AbiEi antitoxin, Type IV TA system